MDPAMTPSRNLGFDVNVTGTSVFIVQVVFLSLVWVTSLMRAFVKLVLLRKVLMDDYIMLLALLGYTATGYFVFRAILDGGLGRPAAELTQENHQVLLKSWFSNMALSGPVSGLARVSIGLFLLRIAVKKWHRRVLQITIGITTVMTIVYFFLIVFQCSPPSYFWEKESAEASGSCGHERVAVAATLVWGSFAAVMDWILGLLPISMLWQVRINRQSKVGIAGILSFGIIAGIALIVRLVFLKQSAPESANSAYATLTVAVSAIVELALGIIAGCVATFPPLFRRLGLHFGANGKRENLTNTIPWQRSLAGPEPQHQGAENIIMTSPRRLESMRDVQSSEIGVRRPRTDSPAAKRVLSSSDWEIDAEAAGMLDDTPPPSGKGIQVRTFIRVSSQPSSRNVSVSTMDFADKPLPPPPPPQSRTRDQSIPRSRPRNPNLF
ncbi:putative integral membrane protein [Rosellinia necatrix]|uniref:Putative integral membrane protein n=1 Tax=Rosellinia necatrix TaxID=77044 RepID=A0A1W2TB73_ROSNE|nr:putative integral membrane protein [Rosellinia necatrix]